MQTTFDTSFRTSFTRARFSAPPPTLPADTIRRAGVTDIRAVEHLVETSCLAPAYDGDERRRVRALFEADLAARDAAIRDGTCYVAESDGRVIGVCAWTARPGLAGAGSRRDASTVSDPASADRVARVCALAVHPDRPPLGLARLLVTLCQSDAVRHGFAGFEAAAGRPQRWLYLACGFRPAGTPEIVCPGGVTVQCLLVRRPMGTATARHPLRSEAPATGMRSYRSFTSPL